MSHWRLGLVADRAAGLTATLALQLGPVLRAAASASGPDELVTAGCLLVALVIGLGWPPRHSVASLALLPGWHGRALARLSSAASRPSRGPAPGPARGRRRVASALAGTRAQPGVGDTSAGACRGRHGASRRGRAERRRPHRGDVCRSSTGSRSPAAAAAHGEVRDGSGDVRRAARGHVVGDRRGRPAGHRLGGGRRRGLAALVAAQSFGGGTDPGLILPVRCCACRGRRDDLTATDDVPVDPPRADPATPRLRLAPPPRRWDDEPGASGPGATEAELPLEWVLPNGVSLVPVPAPRGGSRRGVARRRARRPARAGRRRRAAPADDAVERPAARRALGGTTRTGLRRGAERPSPGGPAPALDVARRLHPAAGAGAPARGRGSAVVRALGAREPPKRRRGGGRRRRQRRAALAGVRPPARGS